MPNYCTVTLSLFSEDAVRLRPLKQRAATSKVTPCLPSTNNIIVLDAFMPHRCLHHFSVGTIMNPVNKLHDHPTFLSTRYTTLQAREVFHDELLCNWNSLWPQQNRFRKQRYRNFTRKSHVLYVLNGAVSSCFISHSLNKLSIWDKPYRCVWSDLYNILCIFLFWGFVDRASQYNLSNWPT